MHSRIFSKLSKVLCLHDIISMLPSRLTVFLTLLTIIQPSRKIFQIFVPISFHSASEMVLIALPSMSIGLDDITPHLHRPRIALHDMVQAGRVVLCTSCQPPDPMSRCIEPGRSGVPLCKVVTVRLTEGPAAMIP